MSGAAIARALRRSFVSGVVADTHERACSGGEIFQHTGSDVYTFFGWFFDRRATVTHLMTCRTGTGSSDPGHRIVLDTSSDTSGLIFTRVNTSGFNYTIRHWYRTRWAAGWNFFTLSVGSGGTDALLRLNGSGASVTADVSSTSSTSGLGTSRDFFMGSWRTPVTGQRALIKNLGVIPARVSDAQHVALHAIGRDGDYSGVVSPAAPDALWLFGDVAETTTIADRINSYDLSVLDGGASPIAMTYRHSPVP